MSFSLLLNTVEGIQNTAGKDYSWIFDFSAVDPGPYEMSFCFYSQNQNGLNNYDTQPNPCVCIDIQQPSQLYEVGQISSRATSRVIGVLKTVWNSNTVATYQSDVNSNPPVPWHYLGKNSNTIRMYVVQPGTQTLVTNGLQSWTAILYFKKI